jgi:hypothetical protein
MKRIILTILAALVITGAGAKANLGDTEKVIAKRYGVEPMISRNWRCFEDANWHVSEWLSPSTGTIQFVTWFKKNGEINVADFDAIEQANLSSKYWKFKAWKKTDNTEVSLDKKYTITVAWTNGPHNGENYMILATAKGVQEVIAEGVGIPRLNNEQQELSAEKQP